MLSHSIRELIKIIELKKVKESHSCYQCGIQWDHASDYTTKINAHVQPHEHLTNVTNVYTCLSPLGICYTCSVCLFYYYMLQNKQPS